MRERKIPLLASPQGGVAASSTRFRAATEADADGVVFLIRKTTPVSLAAEASRHFLIARPPLLAVMQGGEFCAHENSAPMNIVRP
jgi:hypothetical protein